ncbi:MAG: hypothetical protein AMXMBFR16_13090 [Candidatus Uhrbacteria bacterium]
MLARDYARGIIEIAHKHAGPLSTPLRRTIPPFDSDAIVEPPTQAELESKYGDAREYSQLWFSVMNGAIGDFANYVIDSMFANRQWSSLLLTDPLPLSQSQISRSFEATLSILQRRRVQLLRRIIREHRLAEIPLAWKNDIHFEQLTSSERKRVFAIATNGLFRTLSDDHMAQVRDHGLATLLDPDDSLPSFDAELAKRWIFSRVLDLGWAPKLFGEFDRYAVGHVNRSSHKVERVGKKYQWIALHELLARVADRHVFVGDWHKGTPGSYHGAWQLGFVRDIDPTMTLRGPAKKESASASCWWTVSHNPSASFEGSDSEWLRTVNDWPNPCSLVRIADPNNKHRRWLALSSFLTWEDPRVEIRQANDEPCRYTWLNLEGYCVRKSELRRVIAWAKKQDFWGRWMPEPPEFYSYNCYLGEYPWSQAFQDLGIPADLNTSWSPTELDRGHTAPCPLLTASACYLCEGVALDCSLDETVCLQLPAPWMFDVLTLRWNGVESEYVNDDGHVVAFDPSARNFGPGTLLVDEKHLLTGLAGHDLAIIWILLGGKRIHRNMGQTTEYEGELQVSGVAWLSGQNVEVHLNPQFKEPNSKRT